MSRTIALLCALLLVSAANAAAPTYEDFKMFIVRWEGCVHYPTAEGSIGIGHRLHGERVIYVDDEVIQRYYIVDYETALDACRANVKGFDSLPRNAQFVVLSVCWTVGPTGLSEFKHFCEHMSTRQYAMASFDLIHSKWATQVGARRLNDHMQKLLDLDH